ncbi:MAG: Sir2 family NAD-dependent protein deacetylase [Acidobacteriota bacterium]|jgi:NAD-dependent deacetylase
MHEKQTLDAAACAELIRGSERIVAFTGAGISTAAGIPDFRGPQGLYITRRYDPDAVLEISAFRRDPAPFYEFTRDFFGVIEEAEPTFTHRFIAELESEGRLSTVVTQNIDSLHQMAGSQRVISVHGDYWTSHCLGCAREFDLPFMEDAVRRVEVPRCACGGVIKPDIVFFGEAVHNLEEAVAAIASSDLLLVLGSTLVVYPAAFLPEHAGGDVVVVNRGEVGLAPGTGRFFVDAGLDEYFSEVSRILGA